MAIQETTVSGRKRRDELEQIRDLEVRIKEVEARKLRRRQRSESPVLKDFERLKKQMARFAQACMNHQRADMANSMLAFMSVLERQAREVRDTDYEGDEASDMLDDLDS